MSFHRHPHPFLIKSLPRLSMSTLQKWGHDPFLLGNDQPFFKGQKEHRSLRGEGGSLLFLCFFLSTHEPGGSDRLRLSMEDPTPPKRHPGNRCLGASRPGCLRVLNKSGGYGKATCVRRDAREFVMIVKYVSRITTSCSSCSSSLHPLIWFHPSLIPCSPKSDHYKAVPIQDDAKGMAGARKGRGWILPSFIGFGVGQPTRCQRHAQNDVFPQEDAGLPSDPPAKQKTTFSGFTGQP